MGGVRRRLILPSRSWWGAVVLPPGGFICFLATTTFGAAAVVFWQTVTVGGQLMRGQVQAGLFRGGDDEHYRAESERFLQSLAGRFYKGQCRRLLTTSQDHPLRPALQDGDSVHEY